MALARRAYIVGGYISSFIGKGHPDFVHPKHPDHGKRTNPTIEDYVTNAVKGALDATGVPAKAIQRAVIGNFAGELFTRQGHLGAAVVGAHEDLRFIPSMRVEGACASGGLAFASCVQAIQAGEDVCLAVGAEVQTTVSPREGGDYLATASHYSRQRKIDDFTFPALFARRIKAYTTKYGVTYEDLSRVSVKAYGNGNLNPKAHMQRVKMTLEQASHASDKNPNFLSNPDLNPYLRISDCSQVSDGSAALIVMSEEGLRKHNIPKDRAIEVLTVSVATDNLYVDRDATAMETTKAAAQRAYAAAGLKPSQMKIAEVHDCFTMAEVLMYEALGFAEHGEGTKRLAAGDFNLDGKVPVNTGGGLIAFGHPVGATGVKQIMEVYNQMKGKADKYQVKHTIDYGITANMGGDDKTCVVGLYKNL